MEISKLLEPFNFFNMNFVSKNFGDFLQISIIFLWYFSDVYIDPVNNRAFDTTLVKVDIRYGKYGINSFYKLQVSCCLILSFPPEKNYI